MKRRRQFDKILTKEFLIQNYIINKKTIKEVGEIVGCSYNIIRLRLIFYGIKKPSCDVVNERKTKHPRKTKIHKRTCPKCGKDIFYKSNTAVWLGNHKNSSCKSCAASGSNNAMHGKVGALNHFFGKRHTEKSKEKLRSKMKGRKLSPEHAKKVIAAGRKNIVQGDIYAFWFKKYGKEEADRRLEQTKKKHSKNNSGTGNPMYNKPSPQGSGNGWSGWYKGWYFRSLRELKFVVDLDKQNIKWESAEGQDYKVEYIDPMGKQRNYFPDFIVEYDKIVECKPKRLWDTPLVRAKSAYAKEKFSQIGFSYELIDPGKINDNEFKELIRSGKITLTEKYKKKYEEYYV